MKKIIFTFIFTFILIYLIVGYVVNNTFIQIRWDDNATMWHKFSQYYIRSFGINLVLSFFITLIPTAIMSRKFTKK